MKNLFSHHVGLVVAALVACVAFMTACTFTGGFVPPGGGVPIKVSAAQLAQMDAQKQAAFASTQSIITKEAADNQTLAAAATSPADKTAVELSRHAIDAQLASLQADETAWAAQVKTTLADISAKRQSAADALGFVGTVVDTADKGGTPAGLIALGISGLIGLLGGGSMVDSFRKSTTINALTAPAVTVPASSSVSTPPSAAVQA